MTKVSNPFYIIFFQVGAESSNKHYLFIYFESFFSEAPCDIFQKQSHLAPTHLRYDNGQQADRRTVEHILIEVCIWTLLRTHQKSCYCFIVLLLVHGQLSVIDSSLFSRIKLNTGPQPPFDVFVHLLILKEATRCQKWS